VDFANPDPTSTTRVPAQVFVGTQRYANCDGTDAAMLPGCAGSPTQLTVDPRLPIPQNTLVLPLVEPRSYAQDETVSLEFEGRVFPERKSGFLQFDSDPGFLQDPDASFCGAGVQDSAAILAEADRLGLPISSASDAQRDAWASAHADYVQITGDFPASTDRYWTIGKGQQCTALLTASGVENVADRDPRSACSEAFGPIDNPAAFGTNRDLFIREAYNGRLVVTPKSAKISLDALDCCFPSGTAYTVRAANQWLLSGTAGLTDIGPAADGRCVHTASCDPKKRYFRSRAFEVCARSAGQCEDSSPTVGCAVGDDDIPTTPGGNGASCIFENLTSRFAIYRGARPSTRGMVFSWQTTGGFTPMTMALVSQTNAVNPQRMSYLPELGFIAVVDSASLGLVLFNLNSLGTVLPSPFF
jgi:hypothetical protein